jgi:hypothetical protein
VREVADSSAAALFLFRCRDKVYRSRTGLRECPEGRGQGYDLWFPRVQPSPDQGLRLPGESASDAPASTEPNPLAPQACSDLSDQASDLELPCRIEL